MIQVQKCSKRQADLSISFIALCLLGAIGGFEDKASNVLFSLKGDISNTDKDTAVSMNDLISTKVGVRLRIGST